MAGRDEKDAQVREVDLWSADPPSLVVVRAGGPYAGLLDTSGFVDTVSDEHDC
jgi:hypothetical protein